MFYFTSNLMFEIITFVNLGEGPSSNSIEDPSLNMRSQAQVEKNH